MSHIDIFNGDADGICALLQLRNANPVESTLITGVKRDIKLVARAEVAPGDVLTVLDVSLDKNREGLLTVLAAGAEVFYVDHHFAGEIPSDPRLTALIDTTPDVCTSLLVNHHLEGAFADWAVVGAFGDNLDASANTLAARLGLDASERDLARRLGTCINYNGYGSSVGDLHFPPAELFGRARSFASPFVFAAEARSTFEQLESGYRDDMAAAGQLSPTHADDATAIFILPDEAWARRVSGVFSNQLANQEPGRAHAVLTERADGSFLVSVRAPLANKTGADDLCRHFPTGGGRKAAAGINALPQDMFDSFVARFRAQYTVV